jgi:hypothetical protein
MVSYIKQYPLFKKFVYVSISLHVILFFLLVFSPKFPSLGRKKMIHYVSLHSFGGGGGGGGGRPAAKMQPKVSETKEELAETAAETRQTLRDLTTPQKLKQQSLSSLRYPVDNPKREKSPPSQKKRLSKNRTLRQKNQLAMQSPEQKRGPERG